MKGLTILLILALVIGAALFVLLRDSDVDLVRVEDEIGTILDQVSDDLDQTTRMLHPLRVVNPTSIGLDDDLAAYRRRTAQMLEELAALRATRPGSESQRGAFLAARRRARDDARALGDDARGLVARSHVLERILTDTQPRVHTMLQLMGVVAEARTQANARAALAPSLATKLDQLQERVGRTRQLAAEARRVAMQDATEAGTMNEAARRELDAVIQDLEAAMVTLTHPAEAAGAGP